jgi:hypothetical protein
VSVQMHINPMMRRTDYRSGEHDATGAEAARTAPGKP